MGGWGTWGVAALRSWCPGSSGLVWVWLDENPKDHAALFSAAMSRGSYSAAVPLLGVAMICFGAVNAFIGYNLLGERRVQNKARLQEMLQQSGTKGGRSVD